MVCYFNRKKSETYWCHRKKSPKFVFPTIFNNLKNFNCGSACLKHRVSDIMMKVIIHWSRLMWNWRGQLWSNIHEKNGKIKSINYICTIQFFFITYKYIEEVACDPYFLLTTHDKLLSRLMWNCRGQLRSNFHKTIIDKLNPSTISAPFNSCPLSTNTSSKSLVTHIFIDNTINHMTSFKCTSVFRITCVDIHNFL